MQVVSIIIPTCKSSNLKPLLDSIVKYTDLTNKEIIIIANGYDEKLNDEPSINMKVIWHDDRIGYTKATNEGIQHAQGDYIVLLNDDTVLLKQPVDQWISMLLEPFKDPTVGITGPLKAHCPNADRDFIIFFCAMIKKELLGLLDETFNPGGGEDTDFCIKAENAGYKLVQVPDVNLKRGEKFMIGGFPIYHKGESTVFDIPEWNSIFNRNSKILKERYRLPDGWFFGDDIKEYRRLINEVPDNGTIVELGVWKGRSLCSVADIIKRKNLKVFAVDTFEGTENEGDMHEEAKQINLKEVFENNLKRFNILDRVTVLKMKTTEAVNEIGNVDFIFIDADHSYEAVKKDLEDWSVKTKLIAGHDYRSWEGVTKAVNEKFNNVKSFGTIWSCTY